MNNTKLVRNLKIFGTIVVLTVSSYNISDKIINSNELYTSSIEQEQNIDELNDYVLQGLCKVDDKYLLTAYDSKKDKNSIIYILDEDLKNYKTKELDTNSHVGGITYDPINENVWITDINGTISCYDKDEIFSYKRKINSKYKNIDVRDKLNNFYGDTSAAYITYNDNKLYIGNFNKKNKTIIKEYDINKDGTIDSNNYKSLNISEYVQGIAFYEKDNKKYLITSSSYGRFFKSKLRIYDCSNYEEINEVTTKELMEEIIIDNDKLVTLYESNAKIYKNNKHSADIIISDIDKILTK